MMAAANVHLKSPLIPLFQKGEFLCGFLPLFEKEGGRREF
jgi:hypothetical protein